MKLKMTPSPAPFFRRLFAFLYDLLLLFCILLISTACLLFFTHGEAIEPHTLLYQIFLCMIICAYFLWFWMHGGQTTGMRAWGIKLISVKDKDMDRRISFKQALLRLLLLVPSVLFFEVIFIIYIFARNKTAIHDRISGTRVVIKERVSR